MADLQLRIMGEDNASAAFSSVSSAARSAANVIIDFAKESVKAYAESERVQRQLALVAKDLTGAFQQQAQAIAESNNTSDELVMGLQTMLLRYGEAPGAVAATTQAVLDYAAATGTDARAATELLSRGVESGTGHFKGLGISIQATGDRTKDLAAATAELAKKYGGAAAAEAGSLTGQVRGATEAFGELQEMFGGFIGEVANKVGVLEGLTSALRRVAEGAQIAQRFVAAGGLGALADSAKAVLFGDSKDITDSAKRFDLARAAAVMPTLQGAVNQRLDEQALARAKGKGGRVSGGGAGAGGGGGLEGDMYGPQTYAEWANTSGPEGPAAPSGDQQAAMARVAADAAKRQIEIHDKAMADVERLNKEMLAKLASQTQQFAKAGADVGAAFVNNITGALNSLANGGEQDAGKVLASILAGILGTLGSVLGNLILPGIGGAVGGALGGLAGAGVKALANGPTINVNTFDSRSTREFFEADGGRGFYNAQRTGRGQGGR